ncbi:MAG: nucleotidyl transferase AbiEii/AbiGii toxin family protein [Anaerolineae bacterium]|nr:nucleotidyl transferase AbiEii/AbiGii toxin family protein [Anaerolineae bacterium]
MFFLTGGTALAAYYLHHRLSIDLDLFTLGDLALREAAVLVPQLASDLGCRIGRARETEHFRQFLLEPEGTRPLQIDLVRDFGPQYGQHKRYGEVIVDSIENIGANKLTAILGRTEPKDFVDLYFILHSGHNFDDLLEKAQGKDLGLQPFFLAGALRQVLHFQHLPTTTPPLALPELQAFITALSNQLLDRLQPPEQATG